jgi:hypothetical protein
MTTTDFRALCLALGFTAVAMQGDKIPQKEAARRATVFAGLIEEFCRVTKTDSETAGDKA